MPGLKKARQDGREEPIALDEALFRITPDDEAPPPMSAADQQDMEIDLDDDDALVPEPRRRGGGSLRAVWLTLAVLVGLAVVGWAAWLILAPVPPTSTSTGDLMATVGEQPLPPPPRAALPVVAADPEPYKTKPADPGGLQVEDTDKLVYERLGETARVEDAPAVEQLLPGPARPVAPPTPEPEPEPVAPPETALGAPAAVAEAGPEAAPGAEGPPPVPAIPEAAPVPGTGPAEGDAAAPAPAPAPEASPEAMPETAAETAPETAPETAAAPSPAPTPAPPPTPTAENVTAAAEQGPQVQLAAFRERAPAEEQWRRLADAHPDLLGTVPHVVVFADLGERGQFYRLRAGPFDDIATAEGLCRSLKQRDVECLVVRE